MEFLCALYVSTIVPFQLAYTLEANFGSLWLANYFVDGIQVVCSFYRLRMKLPVNLRDLVDRAMCTCCPGFLQPKSMHTETAKQRREKRKANMDNDDDEDNCNWKAVRRVTPSLCIFLCNVPYDLAMWGFDRDIINVIPYTRLIRLVPAPFQLLKHIEKVEKSQSVTFVFARTVRLLIMCFLGLHWISCGFTMAARNPDATHYNNAPWWTQDCDDWQCTNSTAYSGVSLHYLHSIYWSMLTVAQVGHKDVVNEGGSKDNGEVWEFIVAIIIVIFASGLYLYIDANFTSMMLRFYGEVESYRARIGAIDGYLKRHRVDNRLRVLVKQHFKETYQSEGKDDAALLAQMPRSLRREVLKHINLRVLRKVAIFFGCDSAFMGQLCHVLQRVTFIPSEEICKQGDIGREMYFLESGRVQSTIEPPEDDYDSDDMEDWEIELRERDRINKTVVRMYRDSGTTLCGLAFLFGLRQEASLKAIKKTTCLMLPRDEYVAIATEFPGDTFKVREKALVQAKELYGDAVQARAAAAARSLRRPQTALHTHRAFHGGAARWWAFRLPRSRLAPNSPALPAALAFLPASARLPPTTSPHLGASRAAGDGGDQGGGGDHGQEGQRALRPDAAGGVG